MYQILWCKVSLQSSSKIIAMSSLALITFNNKEIKGGTVTDKREKTTWIRDEIEERWAQEDEREGTEGHCHEREKEQNVLLWTSPEM